MATIDERTSKGQTSYRARVRCGGAVVTKTFRRRRDAERWARAQEAAIEAGQLPGGQVDCRLAELLERYSAEIIPGRAARDHGRLRQQLAWWAEQLGHRPAGEISPAEIAAARDRLGRGESPSGRPATAATRNRYLALLAHVYTVAAREWGWVRESPVKRVSRAREPRGRVRYLSAEERERLLAAVSGRLRAMVLVAMTTGLRLTEMLALRWSDVDLERGAATAHHTKNGDRRTVPVAGPALDALRAEAATRRSKGLPLVFAAPSGRAYFPRKRWEAALRAAEIEDFHWHDLRHCAASYLAQSGATLLEIGAILGHRSPAMTARYAHLCHQTTLAAAQRMVERLFGQST